MTAGGHRVGGMYWDLTAHARGALAEALLAEALHRAHADTVLHAPRHPGFDVESDFDAASGRGARRVDAKVASILAVAIGDSGPEEAVEWDGGGRDQVIADDATHLGLVVLDEAVTAVRLYSGSQPGAVLQGTVAVEGRVFVVPGEVLKSKASAVWSPRHHRSSKGRFRYLPIAVAEQYEVEFRFGSTSRSKQ